MVEPTPQAVVPLTGIEPMAYPLGEGRSILLSYRGQTSRTILPGEERG